MPADTCVSPGELLGPYAIERLLGRGAFAEVYLARHVILDQAAALKVIRDPGVEYLEERGARLMCRLDHPNIVKVIWADRIDGALVIAMEYVEGETLEERLRREGPMADGEALRFLAPLSAAVEWLHREYPGVAHLDLKPANILIGASGAKITDFGIAQTSAPVDAAVRGSLAYMAPEQALGHPAQQSDLWALGAILFRMVMGRTPTWSGMPVTESLPQEDANELPPLVRPIILRCLEVNMEKRFANAAELNSAVEEAASTRCPRCGGERYGGACVNCTKVSAPRTQPAAAGRGHRAKRPVAAVAVLLAIILGITGYQGYSRLDKAKQRARQIESLWQGLAVEERAAKGPTADFAPHLESFLTLCGPCAHRGPAELLLKRWRQDTSTLEATRRSESNPAMTMTEFAAVWRKAAADCSFPSNRALALSRSSYWRTQLQNFDGYAKVTAISADGLTASWQALSRTGLPDAFLVLRQQGVEVMRTRRLGPANSPQWNESARLRWKPGAEITVELRDGYWFGSRLLGTFTLPAQTPDGRVQLKKETMEIILELRREIPSLL